jgi:hypothetical protein
MSWFRKKAPRQVEGAHTESMPGTESDDEVLDFVETIIRDSDPENFVSIKQMLRTNA